jgi:acetyltransferase
MKGGASDIDSAGIAYLYNPKSIAIVGASQNERKPGGRPLAALERRGYAGELYPVNPRYSEVRGRTCYASVLEVPGPVDLVIISVPAVAVLDVMRQCGEKGVKAAVIFSGGFAEVGPEGAALQRELGRLAREEGIRVLGPNCLGLINLANSVMASFAFITEMEPVSPRTLSLVTQSGAFGAMLYSEAIRAGVGFSSFTSVGNEADTEFADFVGYLLDDAETQIIGGYLEGAKDGHKLRRVAEKALGLGKPVAIMKVGRMGAGARAASSHTASLAGDDQVYDAFFRQLGIVRIEDPRELTAFAILHRSGRRFAGRRVAILSGSGGHGVMLADRCESLGLPVPELRGATRERLERILPAFGSARNPVDLTAQGGVDSSMLGNCLRALVADEDIDAVLAQVFFQDRDGIERARHLVEIYHSTSKPVVMLAHHRAPSPVGAQCFEILQEAGIPILGDGLQAAKAVAQLAWYQEKASAAVANAAAPDELGWPAPEGLRRQLRGGQALSEFRCKQILEACGIPITREGLAHSAEQAVGLARELGYPVVLKVQSAEIQALGLAGDEDVRAAYGAILASVAERAPGARVEGVLVQEMVSGGTEVIIGASKDPVFGPVVMFGLGGIFVEALGDVAFRVAPLSRRDALEMIQEIKGYRVLQGMRGRPPADIDAIVDAVLRVSRLVVDFSDEIEELDINPLMAFSRGAKAVDALIETSPPS